MSSQCNDESYLTVGNSCRIHFIQHDRNYFIGRSHTRVIISNNHDFLRVFDQIAQWFAANGTVHGPEDFGSDVVYRFHIFRRVHSDEDLLGNFELNSFLPVRHFNFNFRHVPSSSLLSLLDFLSVQ